MTEDKKGILLPDIRNRIFFLRGKKVMLSMDLAELYEVAPKVLMQSVKRNEERFPPDFMFQLTLQEFNDLKSQIVTSSRGGIRQIPGEGLSRCIMAGSQPDKLSRFHSLRNR